jgi:DNA-binding NarL/FixJ family response regulator
MRVLLADDHQLIVEGLTTVLSLNRFDVVGAAANGREAVAQALSLGPDLVLMDLRMPVMDGLAATRLIKAQRAEIKIVILTTSGEDRDLFESVRSGACGYILKSASSKSLVEALHGLEEGVPPFSCGLASRLLEEFARMRSNDARPLAGAEHEEPGRPASNQHQCDERHADAEPLPLSVLTGRQVEVLRLVASGLTYKDAGDRLCLTERTVRYHMVEIMDRLHLAHRNQVIAYAGRLGLK